ncbi:hypothetical protein fugu_006656 [Takifugu bimaculatus]|uniref:Krueppel-like factor 15 n=1 Tax=Takifugu bimaculatus TaxID=433685 RepID=A0A4Z2B498_9TELE|nr:hypothetical protein fugu_006656 [Takifugu bimaculatus]
MVDQLILCEETFYSRHHVDGGVLPGIMVTDKCIYNHHNPYYGLTSSPHTSEEDLSDSSSPVSSICSSPESSSPTLRHILNCKYGNKRICNNGNCGSSTGDSQDSLLDLIFSQAPLSASLSSDTPHSSPSASPLLSAPVSSFSPNPHLPIGLTWETKGEQQPKQDCYEFPVFLDDMQDPTALLFQPTLEEIEEFLEENMISLMSKEEDKSDEGMSTTSEDAEADNSRTLSGEPVPASWNSDQTVPVANSPLSSCTETKSLDVGSSISVRDCSHTSVSSSIYGENDGIKQEYCATPSSVMANINDPSSVPVILQIQPINIKPEPTPSAISNPSTQQTQKVATQPSQTQGDIKIAQLLVSIQGQTFTLVPQVLSPVNITGSKKNLSTSSKFVRIAPVPIAAKPIGLGEGGLAQSPAAGFFAGSQRYQKGAVADLIKMHKCSFPGCNKMYTKSSHLKAHLRRHTGEKPFACTWPGCGWRFSRSDELSRHRRSHSGIKPYQCIVCEKKFARSDHLSKHLKVHRFPRSSRTNRSAN